MINNNNNDYNNGEKYSANILIPSQAEDRLEEKLIQSTFVIYNQNVFQIIP